MLQYYNIHPIMVFDGKNLPAKADTEAKRRDVRIKAKQRASELLQMGKTDEARSYLKQSINITPEMASEVIKECHKLNIDCIVAPYESDAQLAFFNLKGIAEYVITEDSDLVLFGCSKIIFKLDLQGCGSLVEADKIPMAMKIRPDRYTFDKFRYMCILSGCDYIESLRGIGLKKALKFISLTEETNPEIFLDKIPRYLNMRHLQITEEYKENFMVALATFQHQTVFDPFKRKLVPLVDPQITGLSPKFCKNAGEIFDHEKAYQVALGNIHPTSFRTLDNWYPNDSIACNSIWSGSYRKKGIQHIEQKAQFKSFFTATKFKSDLKPDDIEQLKLQEDLKIAKELEFYSHKNEKSEEASTSFTEKGVTENSPEKQTSPVITRNPFIKKKLSKFQTTSSDSNIIVKSRYFNQHSENVEQDVTENKSVGMEYDENEVKPEDSLGIIEQKEVTVNITAGFENKIVHDDNIVVEIEESNINCSIEQSQNIPPDKKTAVEVTPKRKKIGPCRTVGLKRTRSDSKTQQTIEQLFAKLRKK
ncbi:hypothetical protein NQ315_013277 [Exocentrus adspersus]|uniref:Exonuclease 1 n=1 Tax=Exocentrus adspersus TaxID=1586481 RepID=A0AAV8VKX2_9CUCU|nr:hypothetical protein NQ315_013277 [Exocentrus adspersus]